MNQYQLKKMLGGNTKNKKNNPPYQRKSPSRKIKLSSRKRFPS